MSVTRRVFPEAFKREAVAGLSDTSLLASTSSPAATAFLADWAARNGRLKICGVDAQAQGCRL